MPHIEYFDYTQIPHTSTRAFCPLLTGDSEVCFSLRFKKKFHCDKVCKMHAIGCDSRQACSSSVLPSTACYSDVDHQLL